MAYVRVHRTFAQRMMAGLRGWWEASVHAGTAPTTRLVGRSAAIPSAWAEHVASLERDDPPPSPQCWSPVRPGLRVGAALRLEYPYGSAARLPLGPDAADHLMPLAGH